MGAFLTRIGAVILLVLLSEPESRLTTALPDWQWWLLLLGVLAFLASPFGVWGWWKGESQ